jgi:histone acetyltransferase (RNA polymerase elongator complex component)
MPFFRRRTANIFQIIKFFSGVIEQLKSKASCIAHQIISLPDFDPNVVRIYCCLLTPG